MEFEWDDQKNRQNIAKHGVSFSTACRIFEGLVISWVDDRKDYGEPRHHSIGQIEGIVVLAVIHTPRAGMTRLISAPPANRSERNRYEKEIQSRTEP